MNDLINKTSERMDKSLSSLHQAFNKIRTGRANPSLLDDVKIDYYGNLTALNQAANINVEEGRSLVISPWDKSLIPEIEKAIMNANLGFNPMNNGDIIMINVPPLTEERRIGLAKQSKAEAEHAKVGIRNARKDANNDIKKTDVSEDMKKIAEDDIQQLTNTYVKQIEDKLAVKEVEIMKV